jgi:Na+-driven multidrug efflux pump
MIDKASLALCPLWLNKMIGCTAKFTPLITSRMMYDSYSVLKTMEKVSILPGLAFAQVITFLVSNDYKIHHFTTIKRNIKKVLFLSALLVGLFTVIFCLFPQFFLQLLNKPQSFTRFTAHALPYIALLITFDVLQLIISAALRGAADVKTVMWSRMVVTGLFFVPFAYLISLAPIENILLKFILLYISVHLSYALMALVYIIRFKSGVWKKQTIKG